MDIAKTIHVYGDVQGVGFRYSVRSVAVRLGLCGYARNESDGSLTVVVAGEKNAVFEMIEYCRKGSPRANVRKVMVDGYNGKSFQTFEIR